MTVQRISMTIFSHLSDIGEGHFTRLELRNRTNFIKFLMNKYKDDIKQEHDADKDYQEFTEQYPQFSLD